MRGSLGNRGDRGEQWRAVASSGEQGRAGVKAVRRAGFFRWARSVGVSGGGRLGETCEKLPGRPRWWVCHGGGHWHALLSNRGQVFFYVIVKEPRTLLSLAAISMAFLESFIHCRVRCCTCPRSPSYTSRAHAPPCTESSPSPPSPPPRPPASEKPPTPPRQRRRAAGRRAAPEARR